MPGCPIDICLALARTYQRFTLLGNHVAGFSIARHTFGLPWPEQVGGRYSSSAVNLITPFAPRNCVSCSEVGSKII